jgi:hypothetical protein
MFDVHTVRIDRLCEYPDFNPETVAKRLGLPRLPPPDVHGVKPCKPSEPNKHLNALGRIQFFVRCKKQWDPIIVSNGVDEGLSSFEPLIYDGQHRFLAAVLRGDVTIRTSWGQWGIPRRLLLPMAIRDYLTGRTGVKPGAPGSSLLGSRTDTVSVYPTAYDSGT